MSAPKTLVLLILDGWGHRDATEYNAIAQAQPANWQRLLAECPRALLDTSGHAVGLPGGQMGNSEVGHMNIGAGRVVWQDLTRIERAVADGSFLEHPVLIDAVQRARGHRLHVLGLLSPGGVHSHEAQILAMLDLAARQGCTDLTVHAFLDGRDTPPRSARPSLEALQAACERNPGFRIGSVSGRYYAMDRDRRWDRVERAWRTLCLGEGVYADSALDALDAAYARDESDEFVLPTVIGEGASIEDGDVIVFMNFRADRARELSQAFLVDDFEGFPRSRRPKLGGFYTLTEYAEDLPATVAFAPERVKHSLGEVVAAQGLRQLRIAETEKYAHVTFFLNGGREAPFDGEDRVLVPSPQVATYDLQPEMSCPEVTAKLCAAIRSGDYALIVCNIANPDMVGHTGDFAAALKAVAAVDAALGEIDAAVRESGAELLITADHGNIEQMVDPDSGQAHTAHTTNPVPLVYRGRPARMQAEGSLRDIAPTALSLLGLPVPASMDGRALVEPDPTLATG